MERFDRELRSWPSVSEWIEREWNLFSRRNVFPVENWIIDWNSSDHWIEFAEKFRYGSLIIVEGWSSFSSSSTFELVGGRFHRIVSPFQLNVLSIIRRRKFRWKGFSSLFHWRFWSTGSMRKVKEKCLSSREFDRKKIWKINWSIRSTEEDSTIEKISEQCLIVHLDTTIVWILPFFSCIWTSSLVHFLVYLQLNQCLEKVSLDFSCLSFVLIPMDFQIVFYELHYSDLQEDSASFNYFIRQSSDNRERGRGRKIFLSEWKEWRRIQLSIGNSSSRSRGKWIFIVLHRWINWDDVIDRGNKGHSETLGDQFSFQITLLHSREWMKRNLLLAKVRLEKCNEHWKVDQSIRSLPRHCSSEESLIVFFNVSLQQIWSDQLKWMDDGSHWSELVGNLILRQNRKSLSIKSIDSYPH